MNANQSLLDLALAAKDKHGVSGRQLAKRAQDHGFKIVSTTLNHIAAGTYKSQPSGDTIRAIAWLAGVSEEEAFAAAGVPMPGPPFADELPPGVDYLTPRSRRAAIEVLRALVEAEGGGGDAGSSAPKTRAGHEPAHELGPDVPLPDGAFDPTDLGLAARRGDVEHGPDTTTGEESQDPGDYGHDAS